MPPRSPADADPVEKSCNFVHNLGRGRRLRIDSTDRDGDARAGRGGDRTDHAAGGKLRDRAGGFDCVVRARDQAPSGSQPGVFARAGKTCAAEAGATGKFAWLNFSCSVCILDSFRGTLVIDEGDFRLSDERAEIVKILNNGNGRGFPVLRSEVSGQREFNPTAYAVFGPKLVATRGFFEDKALESRCLTEEMGFSGLRSDVPINLPSTYKEEALALRNKLLLFRFRNLKHRQVADNLVDRAIEPRLNQIFVPLLSIIEDSRARADLQDLARRYNRELVAERGMGVEAQVLEVIRDLLASEERRLSIKDITSWFSDRYGEDYERKVTTKWIGGLIRKRLHLQTQRTRDGFVVAEGERTKIEHLYEKYGVEAGAASASGVSEPPPA